jgi:predicted RNA-binding Zn-ribbon protein involved in translation (DUF1610 family)
MGLQATPECPNPEISGVILQLNIMGNLDTLICPSCGGKLQAEANQSTLVCEYCGAEHLVHWEGAAASLESYARCPKCGRNDRAEKVSAVLRNQPKDSDLAKILSPPDQISIPQKPEPLPKPKETPRPTKKPRPELKPEPGLTPIPKVAFSKKNYLYLISGFVLFIASYSVFFIFLGMIFDLRDPVYLLCSSATIILLLVSVFLIYKGYTWKKGYLHNSDSIREYLTKAKKDPGKRRKGLIVFSVISFFLTFLLGILSLVIFYGDIGALVLMLGISFLPSIFGVFFLVKFLFAKKPGQPGAQSKEEIELALKEWEENNNSILKNWVEENTRLLNNWEMEYAKSLEQWEEENTRRLENWEKEKDKILNDWEKNSKKIHSQSQELRKRWEKLYFCHRDDVVFIPEEGTFAQIEQIYDYLLRETS